jgi:Ring finger domain
MGLSSMRTKECSICLEPFQVNSLVIRTDCDHYFHSVCIKVYSNKPEAQGCPLCRGPLHFYGPTMSVTELLIQPDQP